MKAIVKRDYIDKYTDELHVAGETVELTADRAEELSELGFVEAAPAEKPKRKAKK